jgi:phospholipase C
VPVSLPVVAWAITDALKRKTIAISESANAVNMANDLAKCELLIFAS